MKTPQPWVDKKQEPCKSCDDCEWCEEACVERKAREEK